jgi:hypothetical protein
MGTTKGTTMRIIGTHSSGQANKKMPIMMMASNR